MYREVWKETADRAILTPGYQRAISAPPPGPSFATQEIA